jgi:hypothetical protein
MGSDEPSSSRNEDALGCVGCRHILRTVIA